MVVCHRHAPHPPGYTPQSPGIPSGRPLGFPHNLPRGLQDWIAGKEFRLFLGEPPPSHNPPLIDEEERPPCREPAWVGGIMLQHAVTPTDLQVRMIAEERVRELERICKRLLRKGIVRADSEHLDVQVLLGRTV